jgi:hypothetical protein
MNVRKIIIQRRKLLLIIALIGLLVCVVLSSCSCSHTTWYFQDRTFRRLLGSIPDPPGLISRDSINTESYVPYGLRSIEIIGEYDEVIEFYKRELPQSDWQLMRENENVFHCEAGNTTLDTTLVFVDQKNHVLLMSIYTSANEFGIQMGDRVWISAAIQEKPAYGIR